MVANTTLQPLVGLQLHARVVRLDNSVVLDRTESMSVGPDAVTRGSSLNLTSAMTQGPVLVKLELKTSTGEILSQNLYWEAAQPADLRQLGDLPKAHVSVAITPMTDKDGEHRLLAQIHNTEAAAALEVKLTLETADGVRILPTYYSDNYVSLLPGERRTILIRYPDSKSIGRPQVAVRGFNVMPQTVAEH
jgi:FtsP/CotA-like multicopper oxidase with cupredoxin domain